MDRQPLQSPRYHRVFGLLHQRITQGTYPPASQIDTEEELAAKFGVSRGTVRQAVGELVRRGLLTRQQGRGTFVNDHPPIQTTRLVGSLDDLIRDTRQTGVKSATLTHGVSLPRDVAQRLSCSQPTGTVLERIRTIGDEVFAFTRQFMPSPVGELITAREVERYGLLVALHRKGVTLGTAHQTLRAQLAEVEIAERLGIEIAASVLFAERYLCDSSGAPIELVRAWYRSDLYEYQATYRLAIRGNQVEGEML